MQIKITDKFSKKNISYNMEQSIDYKDYLISNVESVLDFIKVREYDFNTSTLLELASKISSQDDIDKLDFYAEQLDRMISNLSYEFGYNHSIEYKKIL